MTKPFRIGISFSGDESIDSKDILRLVHPGIAELFSTISAFLNKPLEFVWLHHAVTGCNNTTCWGELGNLSEGLIDFAYAKFYQTEERVNHVDFLPASIRDQARIYFDQRLAQHVKQEIFYQSYTVYSWQQLIIWAGILLCIAGFHYFLAIPRSRQNFFESMFLALAGFFHQKFSLTISRSSTLMTWVCLIFTIIHTSKFRAAQMDRIIPKSPFENIDQFGQFLLRSDGQYLIVYEAIPDLKELSKNSKMQKYLELYPPVHYTTLLHMKWQPELCDRIILIRTLGYPLTSRCDAVALRSNLMFPLKYGSYVLPKRSAFYEKLSDLFLRLFTVDNYDRMMARHGGGNMARSRHSSPLPSNADQFGFFRRLILFLVYGYGLACVIFVVEFVCFFKARRGMSTRSDLEEE